ncbi:hypothetical protein Tco_1026913 [Tanacetum coccineum]
MINDINTIGMTMQKLPVNTKFMNNLQLEWSLFIRDVKLAKDMHNASFDQLYAYLMQHEVHANEVRMTSLNKAMTFISTALTSRYIQTNNQVRTSSNPKNQATSQDGQEKMLLAQAQEMRGILDKEQLAFLAESGERVDLGPDVQALTNISFEALDNALDYACKFTTRIQELLVYVSATCPSSQKDSEKLIGVTPINKNRQVRVKSSTNASGSHPRSNTRNNRILRPSSSNMKNKRVEVHPRNVKSSLNNMNRVSVCNAITKNVVLNVNSEYVCSTCNDCLFSANHDMCVIDYLNDVNARARAKSVKSVEKNEWKPIGKKFINVGHR